MNRELAVMGVFRVLAVAAGVAAFAGCAGTGGAGGTGGTGDIGGTGGKAVEARFAPFGVRLGERIADPQPALTAESLEMFVLTNGLPEKSYINRIGMSGSGRTEAVELSRPVMGASKVRVNISQDGVGYEFTIYGNFRRGLARDESLAKIEALRRDVERECGFKLNDYAFSDPVATKLSARRGFLLNRLLSQDVEPLALKPRILPPDTVAREGFGPELWGDLDIVAAESVTTHGGLRVSMRCTVNTAPDSDSSGAGKADSPVGVKVGFLLVDELRREESRRFEMERLCSEMRTRADAVCIPEFLGVKLGKPLNAATNELEESSFETWSQGENGEKENHQEVHFWKKSLKGTSDQPVPYVDDLYGRYSLKTKIPSGIYGYGTIPEGIDVNEALCRFDEFAIGFNRRFGTALYRTPGPFNDDDVIQYVFRNNKVDVRIWIGPCRISSGGVRSRSVTFSVEDLSAERTLREEGSVPVKE